MLRFERVNEYVMVYDDEIKECIGVIRYSTPDKAYCFDPFGGIFLFDHMSKIFTEMQRLTTELDKPPFCTFDE